MRKGRTLATVLSLVLASCASPPPIPAAAPQEGSSASSPVVSAKTYEEKVPPTKKQVVEALLASRSVPLSVDPSCSGVGVDPSDSTIGEYLSGFLAEQTPDGENWLDISVEPSQDGAAVWKCNVVVRHVNGDDRWGWGVSFLIGAKDHAPIEGSYRCTGGG